MELLKRVYYKEIPCCILNSFNFNNVIRVIRDNKNLKVIQYNTNPNKFFETKLESLIKKNRLSNNFDYFYGETHEYVIYNSDIEGAIFYAKCVCLHRSFFQNNTYYNIVNNSIYGIYNCKKYDNAEFVIMLKFSKNKIDIEVQDKQILNNSNLLNTAYIIGKCLGHSDLEIRNYLVDKNLLKKMTYDVYKDMFDSITQSVQFKYLINEFINLTRIDEQILEFSY